MPDFDFSRLSSSSFERLTRAIAFRMFGSAGVVYSPGPDGARDFTIEGSIKGYESNGWNGYLVLQAKFRARPIGEKGTRGEQDDVEWLKAQLAKEHEKYADSKSGLRHPDYYVLATNVALSGADGRGAGGRRRKGGHTKIADELNKWKASLGLSGFDIWPADKIADLLADAPDIRQTYAAWVTPGDVLMAAFDGLQGVSLDFLSVIRRALRKSVRRDLYTRLKDAGNVTDDQIRIGQVFVDLPFHGETSEMEKSDDNFPTITEDCVLARLAERAKGKFDSTAFSQDTNNSGDKLKFRNKIVLLGGPGQGKSTVSAYAAQLFRAALLIDDPVFGQDAKAVKLVAEILARAEEESVPVSIPRRYPVLVSLPRFADAVSNARSRAEPEPTLLAQIAIDLSVDADTSIDRNQLRIWLGKHPWLVILDGLDEVPSSGERKTVLQAIEDFEVEASEAGGDVLFVATSRPQGYNQELNPSSWEHWQLEDLQPERALAYASGLTFACYPDDPDRRNNILQALGEAAERPATSRLMISPLQVTIMQMIVDTGGSVPRARWTLFSDYFNILVRREKAKGGATRDAVERNAGLLEPIHQQAGLILHVDSESEGGAGATFDQTRFQGLLRNYLISEGYDTDEVNHRAKELADLALNRLVLLSAREEGQIGFDVRSMQEFMAAAAITSGDPNSVEMRLAHVSGIAHWQHVFLIAASRCFSESAFHYLRQTVCSLPRALEAASESDRLARNGARLAMEMFSDSLGSDHPSYRRQLAQHSIELLELGPSQTRDDSLSLLWEDATRCVVEGLLRERLAEGSTPGALVAWKMAIDLIKKDAELSNRLVEQTIPPTAESLVHIRDTDILPFPSETIVEQLRERFLAVSPLLFLRAANGFLRRLSDPRISDAVSHQRLKDIVVSDGSGRSLIAVSVLAPSDSALSARIVPIDCDCFDSLGDILGASIGWTVFSLTAQFVAAPSATALSEVLKAIADDTALYEASCDLLRHLPWPLAGVITLTNDPTDLADASSVASEGGFGQLKDWKAAEKRWAEFGLKPEDFEHTARVGAYCHEKIADIGLTPMISLVIAMTGDAPKSEAIALAKLARSLPPGRIRQDTCKLANWSVIGISGKKPFRKKSEAQMILDNYADAPSSSLYLKLFEVFDEKLWADDDIVGRLALLAPKCVNRTGRLTEIDGRLITAAFLRRPEEHRGLIFALAVWLASGQNVELTVLDEISSSLLLEQPGDDLVIRISCALLLFAVDKRPAETTAETACSEEHDSIGISLVAEILAANVLRDDQCEALAIAMVNQLETSPFQSCRFRILLKKMLDNRRSRLGMRSEWRRMKFPDGAFSTLLKSQ